MGRGAGISAPVIASPHGFIDPEAIDVAPVPQFARWPLLGKDVILLAALELSSVR